MPATRNHPLSFEEEAARAGCTSRVPIGLRPIRVKRIVGSAGKADKIGPDFRPLGRGAAAGANYRAILGRMQRGEELPPISVYQIGHRFFVIDGHTRVAAAKQLGTEFLDAYVTECVLPKEGNVNLTYYARRELERATGLEGIRLTAPWRYHLLLHHIEGYRLYLEQSREREVGLPEAARIWYRTQYLPTLLEIRRRKLRSLGGGRTAGDVYTDILKSWAEEGLAVSLREMLDRYDEVARREQGPLERAKRLVTNVVDATLPKAVPRLSIPGPAAFVDSDVQHELDAFDDQRPESGSTGPDAVAEDGFDPNAEPTV